MASPTPAPAPDAAVLANATEALYRAALGPGGTAHYLRVFAHFDERGLGGASWNHAAAWLNLSWLIYRRLWRVAALYALLLGLALGLWWSMRAPLAAWSPGVAWGLLALIALLAVAVPGWWGSAWLHSALRTRMTEAVRQARTVQEACEALRRVGPTRWVWVPAVLAQCAAASLLLPTAPDRGRVAPPMAPASAPAPAPLAEPATPAALSPVALADEPAQAMPAAEAASEPASAPGATAAPMPAETALSPVRAQAQPAAREPALREPAPVREPAAVRPPAQVREPAAVRAPAAVRGPTPQKPADSPAPRWQGHGVNVGMFADSANAQRAAARLRQRGLPVQTDKVESTRGTLTRVRAGPFARPEQAEAAAQTVRELGLDAQVFGP